MDERTNETQCTNGAAQPERSSGADDIRALAAAAAPRTSRTTLEVALAHSGPTSALGSPLGARVAIDARRPRGVASLARGVLAAGVLFALGAAAGAHGGRLEPALAVRAAIAETTVADATKTHAAETPAPRVAQTLATSLPAGEAAPSSAGAGAEPASTRAEREAIALPRARAATSRADASSARRAAPSNVVPRAPATSTTSSDASGRTRTLDELLRAAVGANDGVPAPVPAVLGRTDGPGANDAPARAATPTRTDVANAMRAVTPAVEACAAGTHGRAVVTLVVAGETGHVRSATVTGDYAGTPEGSCIARAARAVTLEPFERATFTIAYPYAL